MAFTEFYCVSGGSNLNAGSTTGTGATYTSASGNWVSTTRVFTPTDGSTPSSTVNVGDFASVYANGSTTTGYVGRITAVGAGVNGTITIDSVSNAGTAPSTGSGTRTLKVGGAWKGPNGTDVHPCTTGFNIANLSNSSGDIPRVNLKNNQTYSVSAQVQPTGSSYLQGFTSTAGDGGRATIDGSTNAITILAPPSSATWLVDLVLTSSATTGALPVFTGSNDQNLVRVTASGGRGSGFNVANGGTKLLECEAYNNNKSNTASNSGFFTGGGGSFYRCIAAGNAGSNTDGFYINGNDVRCTQCVSHGNGRHGFAVDSATQRTEIKSCDSYNNAGDGLKFLQTTLNFVSLIEDTNFIKNAGWGINTSITTARLNGYANNCGFGAGTMANGSGNTNNTANLIIRGSVTYENNVTPYANTAIGDFTLVGTNTQRHLGTGRGTFTETLGGFSGTIGHPDIGAAQHNDLSGEVSGGSAY